MEDNTLLKLKIVITPTDNYDFQGCIRQSRSYQYRDLETWGDTTLNLKNLLNDQEYKDFELFVKNLKSNSNIQIVKTTDSSGPKYLRSSYRDDIEEALTYALALVQSRYDHLREKQHKTTKWKERNPGLEKEVEIRL